MEGWMDTRTAPLPMLSSIPPFIPLPRGPAGSWGQRVGSSTAFPPSGKMYLMEEYL